MRRNLLLNLFFLVLISTMSYGQTYDALVSDIIEPSGIENYGDTIIVSVVLNNYGSSPITSMDIGYTINGGAPQFIQWTGSLAPGTPDTSDLGQLIIPYGNFELCAFTALIGDSYPGNDTLCSNYFGAVPNNAGVQEISELPGIAGSYNIYTTILNEGTQNLQSLIIELEINSQIVDTIYWTGNINSNNTSEMIFLGNYYFSSGQHDIRVFSSMPNGAQDLLPGDDTLSYTNYFDSASSISVFPYCESFENTFGNWLQSQNDDFDWTNENSPSPSNNTGPDFGYSGDFYIYTEASNPRVFGDMAAIEALFNFSNFQFPEISFAYHMFGAGMGTMHIDIFDTVWHNSLWSISGNHGDQWHNITIPITQYAGMDSVIFRFRGIVGNGLFDTYLSDMAIDLFCVREIYQYNVEALDAQLADFICEGQGINIPVLFQNVGYDTINNIPVVIEIINSAGQVQIIQDTITGTFLANDTISHNINPVNFNLGGELEINIFSNLSTDMENSNDTIHISSFVAFPITSLPFYENFDSSNYYFHLNHEQNCDIYLHQYNGSNMIRFAGGEDNTGWLGTGSNVTAYNAWNDYTSHHSTARLCKVDATNMPGVMMQFDKLQTNTFENLTYSWFRVLINDSIQVSDIYGISDFQSTTPLSDTFETYTFNLSQFAGTEFSISLQAACKYDENYNINYTLGDQVLIDNFSLFQPPLNDLSIIEIQSPVGSSCAGMNYLEAVITNLGIYQQYDIPFTTSILLPDGTTQLISSTFTDTIFSGEIDTISIGNFLATQYGTYSALINCNLLNDEDTTNNSITAAFSIVKNISSFPFYEDFQGPESEYLMLNQNSHSKVYYSYVDNDYVLRFEGSDDNSLWNGTYGNVTSTNAWIDNIPYQANASSCSIDASGISNLKLDVDFRQSGIHIVTDYSWFRVLINDTIQISDINGDSNFNPSQPQGDMYQLRTFDLTQFAGTQFTISFQSSCKYDSTYTYGSTPYPEGDAVFVRSFTLYEPPAIDISVLNIIDVPEPACQLDANEIIGVEIKNLGTSTLVTGTTIPFDIDINSMVLAQGIILNSDLAYLQTTTLYFSNGIDLSNDGIYNISVSSTYSGDTILSNNTVSASTENIITISSFPYEQDFETNYDGWTFEAQGTTSWEIGDPEQSLIDTAHSGVNAIMTDLDSDYDDQIEISLKSPCFDFSNEENLVTSFFLFIDIEENWDGMIMEGTMDGTNWIKLGEAEPNFYNSSTNNGNPPVLIAPWWSGSFLNWEKKTAGISLFDGESAVQLRYRFATDQNTNNEGVAIDDFFIDSEFSCNAGNDQDICLGDDIQLNANASGGTAPFSYIWTPTTGLSDANISNPIASPTETTNYIVEVTDSNFDITYDTVTVYVHNPQPDLGEDIFSQQAVTLDAGAGFSIYDWSTGDVTQTIQVTSSGYYSVTVTDQYGCQGSDMIQVTIGLPDDYAQITFVVDDSEGQNHMALYLKGSWNTVTGEYDSGWSNGNEHTEFYDDGTHGDDIAGDHIWKVIVNLMVDSGANTWEWGINDKNHQWIDGNWEFTLANNSSQTLTAIISGIENKKNTSSIIYPNPNSGEFVLKLNEFEQGSLYLEVISSSGEQVYFTKIENKLLQEEIPIKINKISTGFYTLKISGKQKTIFRKLIIK